MTNPTPEDTLRRWAFYAEREGKRYPFWERHGAKTPEDTKREYDGQ